MSDEPFDAHALPESPKIVLGACWRYGKHVDLGGAKCPFCAAPFATRDRPASQAAPADPDAAAVVHVLTSFAAILAVSVVGALLMWARAQFGRAARAPDPWEVLVSVATLEAVGTAVVVAALVWIPVRFREPRKALAQRVVVWGVCLGPVLLGVLALNLGYHWALRTFTQLEVLENAILADHRLLPAWIVAMCLQPAVVEELFFRYLTLGTLRAVTGASAAVLLSAVMFAMAHLGIPLSIPVLFVLGLALGYARIASGGLLLPMIMHFLHNGAVIGFDWMYFAK